MPGLEPAHDVTLFPGILATKQDPHGSIIKLWIAFGAYETHKNARDPGWIFISLPPTPDTHSYADVRPPSSAARNNKCPNDRSEHPPPPSPAGYSLVMNVSFANTNPFGLCYNACPLNPDNWDEIFSVPSAFTTDDPPLWTPLVTHADHRQAFITFLDPSREDSS